MQVLAFIDYEIIVNLLITEAVKSEVGLSNKTKM